MISQKKIIVGISAEGSVNLLKGQMRFFKDAGYKTYLLGPYSQRSSDFCKREGCEHLIVPITREISVASDLINLVRILILFIRLRPDIINFGTPKVSLLGMIAARMLGIKKRIYTCRGFRYEPERGSKRKILIAMEKITCRCATQILCISQSLRKLGIKDGIFPENKAFVLGKGSSNGIELESYRREKIDQTEREVLARELNLLDKFVFGFVGRLYERKGIEELYWAFDALYQNHKELRLLLVGPVEEKQLKNKKLIENINSHPAIISIGRVPLEKVPLYLALMDVFVFPSWGEGFGNVLIQAAAMNVPVISTHATGACDAVSDNFNGILVKPKSVEDLKKAMVSLYQDKAIRLKYGNNGSVWAQNFESRMIWNSLNEIYSA